MRNIHSLNFPIHPRKQLGIISRIPVMVQKLKFLLLLTNGEGMCKFLQSTLHLFTSFPLTALSDMVLLWNCNISHYRFHLYSWYMFTYFSTGFSERINLCASGGPELCLLINKFWLCRFEYPQPTFQKLLKEQVMEPFFVFQVYSNSSYLFVSARLIVHFQFCVLCNTCLGFLNFLWHIMRSFLICCCVAFRFSVLACGVWTSIGTIVCSLYSCCLCLNQQWQKVV